MVGGYNDFVRGVLYSDLQTAIDVCPAIQPDPSTGLWSGYPGELYYYDLSIASMYINLSLMRLPRRRAGIGRRLLCLHRRLRPGWL